MMKILLVEDERLVARDLQNVLQILGYGIAEIVSSGEEALRKVEEFLPDLVFMDIKLKTSMDGVTAAVSIRSRFDIPIIFTSALSDQETINRAASIRETYFLGKPLLEDEIRTIVERAFRSH